MKLFFPLLSLLYLTAALLLFTGCAKKKESLPLSSDVVVVPYQELDSTTLYSYEGKYKRWKLESKYMRKSLGDTGSMLIVPVRLTMYDSLGRIQTIVIADTGTTTPSLQNTTLWGNVFIRTKDSLVVKTQKLWWYKDRRKVESNTFVQIETPKGDILRGKGLNAVEDFSQFTFKSEVSGKFPDFKQRMGTNDDSFF